MLHELFRFAQENISTFFDEVDIDAVQKVFERFAQCEGVIFFTGVGKSGLVAQKIASTMTSTGTKALFISPIDALHGDLGIVGPKDIFVFLSKSGETEELLNLVPFLRNRSAPLIGFISERESRLGKACDQMLYLPLKSELCPFDLAPTTSTTTQLIIGDILAIALMRGKAFSMEDYALNHPAGQIGKRSSVKVKDLMVQQEALPICFGSQPLREVLDDMSEKRCGCLVVVDQNRELLGIFTDGDLRRAIQKYSGEVLSIAVEKLMTKSPRSISCDAYAFQAMRKMEEDQKKPITVLPVIGQKKVLGLVKMHDLVQSGV